jgi:hypothetical protein
VQIASLGMKRQSVSLQTLAESSTLQAELGIKVVIRKRIFDTMIPLNAILSDSELTIENGWVWLAADESAIYTDIKQNNDGMSLLHALLGHNMMLTLL